ncbi:hypothetical protein [Corynebacterium amycolatum]|uniref:hypothetical protein n=1 Tax=Corynebacterium amycolatum TaxID=43765 RepID=UPI00254DC543|nr:hypothetical protein [Corynebacterium amycolatum]MDK7145148.1 hypothetical protein [Corynebacterium amycolatum]
MTHGYYISKARHVFESAGGNPDNAMALADWAESIHESDDFHLNPRVIVTEDGAIVATARRIHAPNRASAYYIDATERTRNWGIAGRVADLALPIIRRRTGQRVIEVAAADVCSGAAVKV